MNKMITIEVGLLEMLLNSIANLKHINEVDLATFSAWMTTIDNTWDKGMKALSDHQDSERQELHGCMQRSIADKW